ncbi:MAG: phosphoserine transaminase [bacterium]|nr:phosphoserine transaminase [bacterium]
MTVEASIKAPSLQKPERPSFSSGPCVKASSWNLGKLDQALLGRSHRSPHGVERIRKMLDQTKEVLKIPEDYHLVLLPGGGTGAVETALWSLLGSRPVEALSWDVFGRRWSGDIRHQLKLAHAFFHDAPFGQIPDLTQINFDRDVVFTWNGTTSGVCVPGGNWISENRKGLTICDAVSAVGAFDLPWEKLDATGFSWQKGLGGEGGHGMLALSPRAMERLRTTLPPWPVPWGLSLRREGQINEGLLKGETLNTPSMLCVEDWVQCLNWAEGIGGLPALLGRVQRNYELLSSWVECQPWIEFLVTDGSIRSPVSVCLKLTDFEGWDLVRRIAQEMAQNEAAFDIVNHYRSIPSFRLWLGPTVESEDLKNMFAWLERTYESVQKG